MTRYHRWALWVDRVGLLGRYCYPDELIYAVDRLSSVTRPKRKDRR